MDFSEILFEVVAGKIRNKGLTTLFDTHHPSNAFIYLSYLPQFISSLNSPELLRMNVEETKVTKRLVAVVVGFACCWLPIFIIDNIDMAHREPTLPRPAYLTYSFLLYLSSSINPFIYCATDKRFRREYKAVFWKSFGFKC